MTRVHYFLIAVGLTIFNVFLISKTIGVYTSLNDLGDALALMICALIGVISIVMNVAFFLAFLFPEYSDDDLKNHKKKFKKSVGWRILKEVIDIID
jgi:hypothetical protein